MSDWIVGFGLLRGLGMIMSSFDGLRPGCRYRVFFKAVVGVELGHCTLYLYLLFVILYCLIACINTPFSLLYHISSVIQCET
jgi:hypothetical protein